MKTARTITLMSENRRVTLNVENIYLTQGTIDGAKLTLPVTASNFTRKLTAVDQLLEGGESTEFNSLRLLAELPDGREITVRIQTFGSEGLFAKVATHMNIKLPEVKFNGKTLVDYRQLRKNKKFMTILTERLTALKDLVPTMTVVVSKEFKAPAYAKDYYLTKVFDPTVEEVEEVATVTI